jgi:hypothetical protein
VPPPVLVRGPRTNRFVRKNKRTNSRDLTPRTSACELEAGNRFARDEGPAVPNLPTGKARPPTRGAARAPKDETLGSAEVADGPTRAPVGRGKGGPARSGENSAAREG